MSDPEMSRRAFLRGGFLAKVLCAAVDRVVPAPVRALGTAPATPAARLAARPRVIPVLRPPGAVAEERFLRDCTRCGECITACPHQAIRLADARFRQAAGTPIVDPGEQPCWQCTDAPCITACAPGVLRRDAAGGLPVMGTARISVMDCLAHQGGTCTVCSERCPVPGAITVDGGRPVIEGDACTGCGVCQYVCPAPRNAVILLPRADRDG